MGPAGWPRPRVPAAPFVSLSEQPHPQSRQQTLPLAALCPLCLQAGTWLSPSLTPDLCHLLPAPIPQGCASPLLCDSPATRLSDLALAVLSPVRLQVWGRTSSLHHLVPPCLHHLVPPCLESPFSLSAEEGVQRNEVPPGNRTPLGGGPRTGRPSLPSELWSLCHGQLRAKSRLSYHCDLSGQRQKCI